MSTRGYIIISICHKIYRIVHHFIVVHYKCKCKKTPITSFTNTTYYQIFVVIGFVNNSKETNCQSFYIFILFYPFGCQILFLLFMHKLCPFFLVSYLFIRFIPCNIFFSFSMSAIEFSYVFLRCPLFFSLSS